MKRIFKLDAVNGFQIFVVLRFSFAILTSMAMAKSSLSLSEIGIYEALMLIGAGFTFFWMTGLLNGILPTYPKLSKKEQPRFLFNVFILILSASFVVTTLMWCNQKALVQLMTNFKTLPYFHWICLFLAINLPTFLIEYIYILQNKPKKIVLFGCYAFGGQFLVIVAPLFLGYSLEVSFIGLVIWAMTKFIWLLNILWKYSHINWQLKQLVPYLWVALPIMIYTFVGGVMSYIDGAIIMKFLDEEKFAIYRNGAREFPLSFALLTAMSSALLPNIAENLSRGLQEIKHRTGNIMLLLFGLSSILMFISPWAYPIFFSNDFAESATVFNIYLLLLVSRILLPQTILIGLKKTNIILLASMTEWLTNLGLSLLWIQDFGLVGIALATVVGFTVEKIILIVYCHYYLKIPLSKYIDVRRFTFYSILLVGAYFLSIWLWNFQP